MAAEWKDKEELANWKEGRKWKGCSRQKRSLSGGGSHPPPAAQSRRRQAGAVSAGRESQPGQAKGSGLNGSKLGTNVTRPAHLEDPVAPVGIAGWKDEAGGP